MEYLINLLIVVTVVGIICVIAKADNERHTARLRRQGFLEDGLKDIQTTCEEIQEIKRGLVS